MVTSPRPDPPEDLLQRVREEYRDAPSLRLTPSQAQRLFRVEPVMCVAMLEALLKENFLFRSSDGLFAQSIVPSGDRTERAEVPWSLTTRKGESR